MSEFFEPPPPPPERPEHRHMEWFGPPDNVLPVIVPLELMLARTHDLVLAVRTVEVYPNGALFHIPLLLREHVSDPMRFMPFHRPRGELDPDVLRLGVQYADGAKATNLEMPFFPQGADEQPPGAVLVSRGGGGGGRQWDFSFWLWPLPKEDPFALVVEWPARGIELTRHEIAVKLFVDAAGRCEELWPDSGGAVEGHMTSIMLLRGPERDAED